MLLHRLGPSLLGNNSAGEETIATRQGRGINRASEDQGVVRTGCACCSLNSS